MPEDVIQFTTDASGKWGGGLKYKSERRVWQWTQAELRMHINVQETLMVFQGVEEVDPQVKGQ